MKILLQIFAFIPFFFCLDSKATKFFFPKGQDRLEEQIETKRKPENKFKKETIKGQ